MSSYGRGRADSFPYRGRGGRGGRGFPPLQYGSNRLINKDISGITLLKELENNPASLKKVQELLKNNSPEEESSSFANIVADQDDNDLYERKESVQNLIFILENKDLQWKDEPWHLLQRYLGTASYAAGSYKQRATFESMLKVTDSADIRHFLPNTQAKIYNFSKIIIKQIISVEEWGLNPLNEKEFRIQNQNISVKYNFWDYKEAFYKTFLYQNPQRKHTWFIKICPHVYKRKIPNWLSDWWLIYGADESILPKQFLELFQKWRKVSPAIIEAEFDKSYCHNMAILHFFCEFGIPWIWRWEPEVSYTQQNIPCLKRVSYIKFWKKLIRNNADGIIEGQETIEMIEARIEEYEKRIFNKQQREAFNPFTFIEDRVITKNLSKQEQFDRFMEEAKKAILEKIGPENIKGKDDSLDMFQDSQDPFDLENDVNMADFYSKLYSDSGKGKISSGSETGNTSRTMEEEEASGNTMDEGLKRGSKKKKGRSQRK